MMQNKINIMKIKNINKKNIFNCNNSNEILIQLFQLKICLRFVFINKQRQYINRYTKLIP